MKDLNTNDDLCGIEVSKETEDEMIDVMMQLLAAKGYTFPDPEDGVIVRMQTTFPADWDDRKIAAEATMRFELATGGAVHAPYTDLDTVVGDDGAYYEDGEVHGHVCEVIVRRYKRA